MISHEDLQSAWSGLESRRAAPFLITPGGQRSHGELAELAGRFIAAYADHGVQPADRIVICHEDEFLAMAAFAGAFFEGLVPVMLSPQSPDERGIAVAQAVDTALIVCAAERFQNIGTKRLVPDGDGQGQGAAPAKLGRSLLGIFGSGPRASNIAPGLPQKGKLPRLPSGEEELAYILFTSGTTSSPTGVEITRKKSLFSSRDTGAPLRSDRLIEGVQCHSAGPHRRAGDGSDSGYRNGRGAG